MKIDFFLLFHFNLNVYELLMKILFKIFLVLLIFSLPANADIVKIFQFTEDEFNQLKVRKVKGETKWALGSNENGNYIRAEAEGTGSGLGKEVIIDLNKTPFINITWKVEKNLSGIIENSKKTEIFSKSKFPSGFITNYLLNDYVVKMGTIIIKSRIARLYKFNQNYNIIGDFDFILRVSEKFKAKAFNDLLVTIRIHQNNFSHTNRKLFYNEFKSWIKSKNLDKSYYRQNKNKLFLKLEYLRLVYLILEEKRLNLIVDIIRYPFSLQKLKLLLIFFVPSFFIKFKLKYF